MKQSSKMEYYICRRLVLLFVLVILTKSEMYEGKLQIDAMPELYGTSAKADTKIESTSKPTVDEQPFRHGNENTSWMTNFNASTTGSINRIDQLNIHNNTIFSSSNKSSDSESEMDESITTPRVKCLQGGCKTNFSVSDPSFADSFKYNLTAVSLAFVGSIVVILNLIVIVVSYSTKKLRQDTYLNLILTLSVNDFIFGLSTVFSVIRRLSSMISSSRELCIFSNIALPVCLIMTLYQTFLISLHRYLVVSGSVWGKNLFIANRNYIWYLAGWAMIIILLSAFISPIPDEFGIECSVDIVFNENKIIVMLIVVVTEFFFIFLILLFYCLTMCTLKRHYLDMSHSKMSKTILENRHKKFLKSMKSVNTLLLVLFIFSGPFLARNLMEIFLPVSHEVLLITFALTNINSFINPLIYFTNLEEFKAALRGICLLNSQTHENTHNMV